MWGYFERERHKSDGVFVEPLEQRQGKEFLLQVLPWKISQIFRVLL